MEFKVLRYKTISDFQDGLNREQPEWLKDSWTIDGTWGVVAVYIKQNVKEPAVAKIVSINRMPIQTSPFREAAERSAQDWNNVAAFTPKPQEEAA